MMKLLLLVLAAAGSAWGQFELYLVNGNVELPVAQAYNFGAVEPGATLLMPFRIRNVSSNGAALDLLTVNGAGFSFTSVPTVPLALAPEQSLDFTVAFQSASAGSYSAALESVGISAILTAVVPVELTCQLVTASGAQPCAGASIDFGSVARGAAAARQFRLLNETAAVLLAPGPLLSGGGFALSGPSPGGTLLQPGTAASFEIQFSPTADGPLNGVLTLDARTYGLTGTGVEPPLPRPQLSVSLAEVASAQQGAVAINLSAASETSGSGTVSLSFTPAVAISADAPDPEIAFASGGQSATFTVSNGDTQGHFGNAVTLPFATGTTAGTLTIAIQLGSSSDKQSIVISPAAVGLTGAQAARAAGTVEIDLTGFDNTRTAGALSFTFFDAGGNVIGPPVAADGGASFAAYFQNSAGGTFELKAVFPVLGASSRIAAFQAAVTNSAGTARTAITNF